MTIRLVAVGGVAAGMSAASKARRMDPEMEIIVYERNGYVSCGACGLPYYVQGLVPDHNRLIARTPEQFAKQNIQGFTHHEVTQINPEQRWVQVRKLETGEIFETPFDSLMLSTGGYTLRPPIPGLEPAPDNLFAVCTVEDGIVMRRFIEREHPERAVIIGVGYIGLEMTEALVAGHDLDVTVLTLLPPLRPTFDEDMSEHVLAELARHDVRLHVQEVQVIERQNGRAVAVHVNHDSYPADLNILAAGVRPDSSLAQAAGIACGPTGAVAVDDHQRTNIEGIYAGGDVAEAVD